MQKSVIEKKLYELNNSLSSHISGKKNIVAIANVVKNS